MPVVLYHGDERWSAARTFDALLDVPEAVRPALAEYLVRFAYVLDNLSEIPDDRLRTRDPTTAFVDLCLKHAWRGAQFVEILSQSGDLMREARRTHDGREAFRFVVSYILIVNDTEHRQALTAVRQGAGGVEGPGSQSSNGFLRPSMQRTMRLSTHSATSCWPSNVSSAWPSW